MKKEDYETRMQEEQQRLRELASEVSLDSFLNEMPSVIEEWEKAPARWYGEILNHICNLLNSAPYSGNQKARIASWEIARRALETKRDSIPVTTCVELLFHLASQPFDTGGNWPEWRRQNARLWLSTWHKVNLEQDEAFDPGKMPPLNVAPPAETGLPPGVAPEEIEDPALREKYIRAIEANRRHIDYYNRQYRLRRLEKPFIKIASDYLTRLYALAPDNKEEIANLLNEYRIASPEADAILHNLE